MLRLAVLALLSFAALPAGAFQPEDGWWWSATESGRGWNIETQNGLMGVSTFAYAADGRAQWYTSLGQYDRFARRFSAPLNAFRGGQCLGCSYRAPQSDPNAGQLTIVFDTSVSGTITYPGGTSRITRQYYNFATPDSFLFGEWAMSHAILPGLFTAEWVELDDTFTSNGVTYVAGNRESEPLDVALGRFDPSISGFIILMVSSSTNYRLWQFDMGKDRMEGRTWLFAQVGGAPTGSGLAFFGARMTNRYELPTAPKSASDASRIQRESEELALSIDPAPAPKEVLRIADEMMFAVEQYRSSVRR